MSYPSTHNRLWVPVDAGAGAGPSGRAPFDGPTATIELARKKREEKRQTWVVAGSGDDPQYARP